MVYVDGRKPGWRKGFCRNTFIAMVRGVHEQARSHGLINQVTWNKGLRDLERASESTGTFCSTFFGGHGVTWRMSLREDQRLCLFSMISLIIIPNPEKES